MPENIGIDVLLTFVAYKYQKTYDFIRNSVLDSGPFEFFGLWDLFPTIINIFHLKEHINKLQKKLVSEDHGGGGRRRLVPIHARLL